MWNIAMQTRNNIVFSLSVLLKSLQGFDFELRRKTRDKVQLAAK